MLGLSSSLLQGRLCNVQCNGINIKCFFLAVTLRRKIFSKIFPENWKWKIANFTIIIPTLNNHNIFLSIWKCLYLKVKCLFCWWYDMCNVLYNQLFMVLWQVTKYYGHYYYQLKQGHLVRDINRNKYLKLSWQLLISLYFLLLKVYKHKQINDC